MYTPTLWNTQTNKELRKVVNYNFKEGDLSCKICKRVHKISELSITYLASYINKLEYWRCYPQSTRPKLNCIVCYNQNTQEFYTCAKCGQQKPLKNYPKAKKFENDNVPCLYCIRVSKGKYINKPCYKTPNYEGSNSSSPFNVSGGIVQQSNMKEDNLIKKSMQPGFERTPVIDIIGLSLSEVGSSRAKCLDSERSDSPSLTNSGSLNQQLDSMTNSQNIYSNPKNPKSSNVQNLLETISINQQPDSTQGNLVIDPEPKIFGPQILSNTDPSTQQPDTNCSKLANYKNSMDNSNLNLSNSNFINQELDSTNNSLIINTNYKTFRTQTFHNSSSLNQQPDSRHENQITPSESKSSNVPSPLNSDPPDQQPNLGHNNSIIASDESCIYTSPLKYSNTVETQLQEQIQSEILLQPAEDLNIAPFNFNMYSLLQLIGRKNLPLPTEYLEPFNSTKDYYDERNSSEMDMEEDYQFLDLNLQPIDLPCIQRITHSTSFQHPDIENNMDKTVNPNQSNMDSEQTSDNLGISSVTANSQLEVFGSNNDAKRSRSDIKDNIIAASDKLEVNGIDNDIKRIRTSIDTNSVTSTSQMESGNINHEIQQNFFNTEASSTTGDEARDEIFNNSTKLSHDNIKTNPTVAISQLEVDSISENIEENNTNFEANLIPFSKIIDVADISSSNGQIYDQIEDHSTNINDQFKEASINKGAEINDTNIKASLTTTSSELEGTITISDVQKNNAGPEASSNISNQQYLANIETSSTDIINQPEDSGVNKSSQEYSNNEASSTTNNNQLDASSINSIQQNISNNFINSTSFINQIEPNNIGNIIAVNCTNAETNPSTIINGSKVIDNRIDTILNSDRSDASVTNSDIVINSNFCNNDPKFEEDSANSNSETKGSSTTSKFTNNPQISSTYHNNPGSNPLLIPPLGAQLSNGLQPLIATDECRNKVFSLCQVFENPNASSTEAQSSSVIDNLTNEAKKQRLNINDRATQEKVNLSTESLNSALITPTKLVTKNSTPSNFNNN